MDNLITRLRTYRAHDATADALMDEAAARIEELERIGRAIMDTLCFQGREYIDFIELGLALHYDPWPEGGDALAIRAAARAVQGVEG